MSIGVCCMDQLDASFQVLNRAHCRHLHTQTYTHLHTGGDALCGKQHIFVLGEFQTSQDPVIPPPTLPSSISPWIL